jgi:apolipoprotein N-acyltransferase
MFAAASGGMAAGFSQVLPALWPLAFVAPVPLILAVREPSCPPFRAAFLGFLFGAFMSGVAVWWLWDALPADWLVESALGGWWLTFFSWGTTALFMSLGTALFALLARTLQTQTLGDLFLVPFAWILGEEARMWSYAVLTWAPNSLFEPHFSFGALGYALAHSPAVLQLADPGGVRSLSFFTVFIAIAIVLAMEANGRRALTERIGVSAAIVFLVLALSAARTDTLGAPARTERVALITTYLPLAIPQESLLPRYEALLLQAAAEKPHIVVFPEGYGMQGMYGPEGEQRAALERIFGRPVLVVSTAETEREDGIALEIQYLDSNAGISGRSEKRFLAPMGESVPLLGRLAAAPFMGEKLRAHIEDDARYRPGAAIAAEYGSLRLAGLFCSEIASPSLYARLARDAEPDLLLNLASQSWFHGSRLIYAETLAMAKVHAVQNRAPFIAAMNGAPSYALDARGRRIAEAPWGEEGVMLVPVPLPALPVSLLHH